MPYVIDDTNTLRRVSETEWAEWSAKPVRQRTPKLSTLGTAGPSLPGGAPLLVLQWAHRYARERGERLVGGAPPWGMLLAEEREADYAWAEWEAKHASR